MTRQSYIEKLSETILVDRQATHGRPEDSFQIIAEGWDWFLRHRKPGPLQAHEVCQMMVIFKSARTMINPQHADNWLDGGGYNGCGVELATEATPK